MHFSESARRVFRVSFLASLLVAGAWAQNASIIGTVRDPQSAVVHSATITLTNSETRVSQSTQSDDEGIFQFPLVRPGSYTLRATAAGFRVWEKTDITLAVDQRGRVDPLLEVGDASTLITVSSEVS